MGNKTMQQQRGFTLIELIIVIVILGILAVTAAPRFIDLQGDAQGAALRGVEAALAGGAQLVYAKAAIEGLQDQASTTVDVGAPGNQQNVNIVFGYPDAAQATATLAFWADIDVTANTGDFVLTVGDGDAATPAAGSFAIMPAGGTFRADNNGNNQCQVLYTNAVQNQSPTIVAQTAGC